LSNNLFKEENKLKLVFISDTKDLLKEVID